MPAIDLGKSGLVVLDGDRHGGPDGRAALRDLLDTQDDFDRRTAPAVVTPADGLHIYFHPNGHALTNTRGDLSAGIDVRGVGGYVVAPNAVLPDGRRYAPIRGAPELTAVYPAGAVPHTGRRCRPAVGPQTGPGQASRRTTAGQRQRGDSRAVLMRKPRWRAVWQSSRQNRRVAAATRRRTKSLSGSAA